MRTPGVSRTERRWRCSGRKGIEMKKLRWRSQSGAATAEYAIATMAAVGFAGLLVVILRSDEVRGMLTEVIRHALSIPG
jgi:Protein of unknown function (DUF4244)